jgi:hypothetical protein
VIKQTVDATAESIESATKDPEKSRKLLDELRNESLGVPAEVGPDGSRFTPQLSDIRNVAPELFAFVETITTAVRVSHSIGHLMVSELETMGNALLDIRRVLANLHFEPEARKQNRGAGARGADTKGGE